MGKSRYTPRRFKRPVLEAILVTTSWGAARRYVLALAIFALALGVRLWFFPIASGLPYLTFYPGLILSLLFCGTGPGVLVALLVALTAYFAFLPPYGSFTYDREAVLATAIYLFSAAILVRVVTALHSYSSRLSETAAELRASEQELSRELTERKMLADNLEQRVAERTEQLRALASDLEAAESRERRQLARDLHDDLGQTLAAARVRLAGLCADPREDVRAPAKAVATLIDQANASTSTLAAQLSPAVLYELGLPPALEWLAEEIGRTFGLEVSVHDDGSPKPLSQESRSILYRGVRELVINVAKHAQTDSATIEVMRDEDRILIRVSDAGVGYDAAALAARPRRGLGLVSVRERLSFIGGNLTVRSIPGDGTQAVLSAPLSLNTESTAEWVV